MNRFITITLLLIVSCFHLAVAQQRTIDKEFLEAVQKKDIAGVNSSLLRGANINAQEPINGNFALQYAINWPDLPLVKLLLDKGADVNLTDKNGSTALTDSAGRPGPTNAAIVKLLIARGADVHANGDAAILHAAREAEPEVLKLLLEKGAPVNVRYQDSRNDTVLMSAANGSSVESLRLLLAAGADLKATNNDGQTALIKAVRLNHSVEPSKRLPMIELLLSKGADINQADKNGQTPLLHSVDQYMTEAGGITSHPEVVKLLLERGANVKATNSRGDTALLITANAWRSPIEIARLLLAKGVDLNAQNKKGTTALMAAIEDGRVNLLNLFLEHGADLNLKDAEGSTALDLAVTSGRLEIAKALLVKGAHSATVYKSEADLTKATINYALLRAASSNNLNELKELIALGADLNTRNRRGLTPLMLAIENSYGKGDSTQLLLNAGADVNAVDNNGNSALMTACDRNDFAAVTLLLEKKAAVNIVNKERRTALHIAAKGLRRKIVAALLSTRPEVSASSAGVDVRGVEVNGLDEGGRTPLMLAADNEGYVPDEVMELLLNKGARIDLQDPQGNTALMFAARAGSMAGVEFLLTKGATVNLKNKQGQTALKMARSIHESKKIYDAPLVEQRIVDMLVKAGAKE